MSFVVRKPNVAAVTLDDLGITLSGIAGSEFSLRTHDPKDIQDSADLAAAIVLGSAAGGVLVLDPRDDSTALSTADGEDARAQANDTHWGINGGRFDSLDDPGTSITDNFIVQYDSGTDSYESKDPDVFLEDSSTTIGQIIGGMGVDGTDSTFVYDSTATILIAAQDETVYDAVGNNGTFVGGDGLGGTSYAPADTITLSDGSVITVNTVDDVDGPGLGDVVTFTVTTSGGTNVTAGVTLTQTGTSGTGTGFTLTPESNNISAGTVQWDVDDSFLRNTGDTLDSGTLTIASGATLSLPSGSTITIDSSVTSATIGTPGGGFTGDTDIINKLYVDSVANGLDWKDSVRACTDTGEDLTGAPYNGTYSAVGGTAGTGEFTGVDLTNALDGITLVLDDRLLVKNQGTGTQNGIYIVTTAGAAGVLERAPDSDTDADVTSGNATFVEEGTVCADTAWVITTDDPITLNTTAIVWTQFAGAGAITAGIGLSRSGIVIDLDVNDLTTATAVVGDIIAFHDLDGAAESSGSQTKKTTFSSLFAELDVPNAITANGLITRTAADTYASRSITVNGAGNLDGLVVSNGDGVAANPILGLDIQNLPARSTAVDTTDRVAVWRADGTDANEYYLISEIAGAVGASDSFATWARTGNGTGASLVADSSADTVTLDGGIGIDLTFTPASDTVSFAFTDSGMADTAVVGADTVPFFDASNSGEPEFRSFTNIISDLGILTGISAATGEDLLGIDVTGTVIGLDILGLTDGAADMAATDEFPVHDKSEGTAGANRKMTGQNIADGVETILGITGLTIATINGQPIVVYTDSTRTKTLSTDSHPYVFANNALADNEWMDVGDASNTDLGITMPLNGTIVMATGQTEDDNGNTFELDVYIDAADSGSVGTLTGGANSEFQTTTLDLDFSQGDKLRVRGDRTAGTGSLGDVNVVLIVRWRA